MVDHGPQRNGCDDGHAQGQDDAAQDAELGCAVDARGFLQRSGQRHHVVAHDQQVERVDQSREHQRPNRIVDAQIAHEHVIRDHAAGEEHGEGDQECDAALALQVGQGQRIGRHDGQDHVEESAAHGIQNGVFVAVQNVRAGEHPAIAVQRQLHGPQHHFTAQDVNGLGQGRAQRIDQRIQGDDADQHGDHIDDDLIHAVAARFPFHCFSLLQGRLCLRNQNRLV